MTRTKLIAIGHLVRSRVGKVWVERLAQMLSGLSGLIILCMVMASVSNVAIRWAGRGSIGGMVEWTEVGLVAAVFLGLMGAQVHGHHIRTPMLTNRLPARAAHAVRALALLIGAAFLIWVTRETAVHAIRSVQQGEYRYGLAQVPIWPARVLIPIGTGAFALAVVVEAVRSGKKFVRHEPADVVEFESSL